MAVKTPTDRQREWRRRKAREKKIAELIASGEATTFGEAIAKIERKEN